MAVTDQPSKETESLEQPEPVDGGGDDAKAQVETEGFEAPAAAEEQVPQSSSGDAEPESVSDGSGEEEQPVQTDEADEPSQEPAGAAAEQAEEPPEEVDEEATAAEGEEELQKDWYILKVQVNREDSIRDALLRRVKIEGVEEYFGEIVVPTEEVAEFNKSGKRRVVKKKLYPGYILVNMAINDDTWFLVRETPGVGDFTGSAGKPTPMDPQEVERILKIGAKEDDTGGQIRTAIPFRSGDRVRVKDGYFQNFEGDVEAIDEANGRITVMINIFGRSTPVELEHWQVEAV